ncbi:MAG TPA: hypothetical protein VGQ53_19350 [Chitinophagaceae bacterium]|jgi:hypothetical protein|nr:hypothetical protein [Chitinophagaceae bacterium]
MKKIFLAATCSMCIIILKAQTDSASVKKQKVFNASVATMDDRSLRGSLSAVNDTQLILRTNGRQLTIPAENLKSFTIKRKNSVLKGALIGFGIGAAAGVIIGLASGDDPVMTYPDPYNDPLLLGTMAVAMNNAFAMTAGEKAVAGGLGLGATGAIVGTIIGAVAKKKFIIGGKKEKFHDLQGEIMRKLVKK